MNLFINSEITCRLPPLSVFDRVLMVLVYTGSAVTVTAALTLLLSMLGWLP